MEQLLKLIDVDKSLSTILSLIWVVVIGILIKGAPKLIKELIGAWRDMVTALQRSSNTIDLNSDLLKASSEAQELLGDNVQNLRSEVAALKDAISHLERQYKDLQALSESERRWAKEQMRLLKNLYRQLTGEEYREPGV